MRQLSYLRGLTYDPLSSILNDYSHSSPLLTCCSPLDTVIFPYIPSLIPLNTIIFPYTPIIFPNIPSSYGRVWDFPSRRSRRAISKNDSRCRRLGGLGVQAGHHHPSLGLQSHDQPSSIIKAVKAHGGPWLQLQGVGLWFFVYAAHLFCGSQNVRFQGPCEAGYATQKVIFDEVHTVCSGPQKSDSPPVNYDTRWCPSSLAFSCFVTWWILWFMVDITIDNAVYKPTYN